MSQRWVPPSIITAPANTNGDAPTISPQDLPLADAFLNEVHGEWWWMPTQAEYDRITALTFFTNNIPGGYVITPPYPSIVLTLDAPTALTVKVDFFHYKVNDDETTTILEQFHDDGLLDAGEPIEGEMQWVLPGSRHPEIGLYYLSCDLTYHGEMYGISVVGVQDQRGSSAS